MGSLRVYRDYFRILLPNTCRSLGATIRRLLEDGKLAPEMVARFKTALKDLFSIWAEDGIFAKEFLLGQHLLLNISVWKPTTETDQLLLGLQRPSVTSMQQEILDSDESKIVQRAATYGLDTVGTF